MSLRPRTSTRLSIATQALDDARARLKELPNVETVRALREEVYNLAFEVRACRSSATLEERAVVLERVLKLHVAVTQLARTFEGR